MLLCLWLIKSKGLTHENDALAMAAEVANGTCYR